jgi:gamma-glutamyltranspeptidase/glutathione hydrolase
MPQDANPTTFAAAPTPPRFSALFTRCGVAADHKLASRVGAQVLRDGGNAVDAAVATSFALSVVRPYSCGIGGGGFLLAHFHQGLPREPQGKHSVVLDYRETCPAAIGPNFFESGTLRHDRFATERGGLAVGVPGHVRGMLQALRQWGTREPSDVLAGAIALALDGFEADEHYVESSQEIIEWIEARDAATKAWLASRKAADGPPQPTPAQLRDERIARFPWLWSRLLREGRIAPGDHLRFAEQGELLRRIARDGDGAFYEGPCAQAIVDAASRDGGVLTLADLKAYAPKLRDPFVTKFLGKRVLSMPPPSSGGIVLAQVFTMLDELAPHLLALAADPSQHNSARAIHLVAECCKHAFADRAHYLGDTDFAAVELASLLDEQALRARACAIDLSRTQAQAAYGSHLPPPALKGGGTSHLCVVDRDGNAVACTETINLVFGSLVAVEPMGFVLNDTIDDFLTRAGEANAFGLSHAERNRPQPGKRPLSAMTPTIVLDDDRADARAALLAGASGGPRIISGTLQAMLNMLVWKMPAWDAVQRPRFHHQWSPHTLQLEDGLIATAVQTQLEAMGHEVGRRQPVAAVQVMRRVPARGDHGECDASIDGACHWQAASDPRKGGAPDGD